jgi:cytochrome d ubiquinol oxidase subunit II
VVSIVIFIAATIATGFVRPTVFVSLLHRPWLWPLAIVVIASPAVILRSLARGAELRAFLASCAFVASLMLMTAGVLYPVMLASTVDPSFDLDAQEASSGPHGLTFGLAWWVPAAALAVLYMVTVYRSMRGKVRAEAGGH